ncbi:hypothetical protein P280DRAFT_1382 [Massarina eburnea CBS 473.64]|uniref:Uncharacterized protein n=1 Tax=Massarina eburnea CBS 473.64 TaxID=1395130 RepID=A0A6A6SIN4_9PLEO|nr:hypothetical protein P280DRAFT_1382 [Massarina eburnea CBS 473.64]
MTHSCQVFPASLSAEHARIYSSLTPLLGIYILLPWWRRRYERARFTLREAAYLVLGKLADKASRTWRLGIRSLARCCMVFGSG